MKEVLATVGAPPALGPYAQGIKVGDTVYISGQLPMDPGTGELVRGSMTTQVNRVLMNIRAILEEAGATLEDVVKITIYMRDLNQFEEVNDVFARVFPTDEESRCLPPARSTVEVSRLPRDAGIEMDAIAVVSGGYVDSEFR